MQLKDYQIPRSRVPLPGKKVDGEQPYFEVRGLCADDLTFLIGLHVHDITRALTMYQESKTDILASGSFQKFVLSLSRDFPHLMAEVISAATDSLDDETRKVAGRLPVGTQITAISEITRLTLEDTGGLKNLLAEMQARLNGLALESGSAAARPKTI